MIQKRDVATNLLLTLITCGIYGIFWLISITNETAIVNKNQTTSAGMTILLTVLTCGIYSIYWNYKTAQLIYETEQERNIVASNNAIVCLILSLFGLDLVSYCILQSELNRISDSVVLK
ncbi:MAG: DUF4234 domain-containing protein [Bacilli bacterium]